MHYKIPGLNLKDGLRVLYDNESLLEIYNYLKKKEVIEVYVVYYVYKAEKVIVLPKGNGDTMIGNNFIRVKNTDGQNCNILRESGVGGGLNENG